MACSYPISLNDKTTGLNGRLVPCGKCINCIQRKRAEWSFRLLQELKISERATFLTLTYSDEYLPKTRQLEKKKLQLFFKRVRVTQKAIKYYAVGEYGTKNKRPHYHAIVYNCDNNTLIDEWRERSGNAKTPIGFVSCDTVTEASIHYVTGYITTKYGKIDERTGKSLNTWSADDIRPFALMSKGLGKIYLKYATKYHKSNFTTTTISAGGVRGNLPRYYKERIFTDTEKKELAQINSIRINEAYSDHKAEFEKRQYNKLIVKNQIKKKIL
nr:MAG: replication initiator protein [Microvirus sp.]